MSLVMVDVDEDISTFQAWLWIVAAMVLLVVALAVGQANQKERCAEPGADCTTVQAGVKWL